MADLVTADMVGALIRETIIILKETIPTVQMFRSRLIRIQDRLDSLKPLFEERKLNDWMGLPFEELRPMYDMLISCQRLVKKCKKIKKWQIYDKNQCLKELQDLDYQIVTFCTPKIDISDIEGTKTSISELKDAVNAMNAMRLKDELLDPVNLVESTVKAISYEYDVFLSFRGYDTRESFTGTLFYTLSTVYKVKTFMDVIFKKGSKLDELLKMVEKSRISIVVFSENFAESEWCLKELAKIFEECDRREHEILPVFYKINPSELRNQDIGKTKGHMEKHHNKYGKDSDTVKSWSNAMKELGNSSGYTYWSGRGKQEVELAVEISQEILKRLQG